MNIAIMIIVGLVISVLGELFFESKGTEILAHMAIGSLGALIGVYVFGQFKIIPVSLLGTILTSAIGALILLFLENAVVKSEA